MWTNILVPHRMKWISDIRSKLGEFVKAYMEERELPPNSRSETIRKYFEVVTFMDFNKKNAGYEKLRDQLQLF